MMRTRLRCSRQMLFGFQMRREKKAGVLPLSPAKGQPSEPFC